MSPHRVTVDEMKGDGKDVAYAAFCDCGWPTTPTWHHADTQRSWGPYGREAAYDEAQSAALDDGYDHLSETKEDQ